ncbi:hypothetical protein KQH49_07965 [Mycetohabitans sp. B5]|uniref:Uncharacterized protein n=1 Tax=Mycetohabitans endofungorum TaxID=417203 RepID=A0A2P5KAT6_9BURK|nr:MULTISPECIES: hypothetical protein [Mycetohabitans]MCG1054889.1 hypothetical protein [Mycetohabitans sp. B5]PPB83814.1 hypothetical protein B0O95_106205 [Mycetohabitans endofungorum]
MSARLKTPHGVAPGFTRRGSARSSKQVRITRRIEPRLGPAGTRAADTRSHADSPASDGGFYHARQQVAEPAYATTRPFDTTPPSFVTPPWTGLQRAPLARRHTVALAALLALGAGALGVTLSQLYQDRTPSEPHRYADAMSREAPTQTSVSASIVPLFDAAVLASNTAHLSAQAPLQTVTTPSSTPPSAQTRVQTSDTVALASIPPARSASPASMDSGSVQRNLPRAFHARARRAIAPATQDADAHTVPVGAHPTQHAVAAAVPAEPMQPAADTPSVSRAEARAATDALTQDAITPLPPQAARVDPTQPPVVYGVQTVPSTAAAVPRPPAAAVPHAAEATGLHAPPSAAEATAALTAQAVALPSPQTIRPAAAATRPATARPPADTDAAASINDEPAAPINDQYGPLDLEPQH